MRFLLVLLAMAGVWAQDGATHADWPHYGGTQLSWRYSALDQVNAGNVKSLVPGLDVPDRRLCRESAGHAALSWMA